MSAVKSSNNMQQPMPRPMQQVGRPSRVVAASGDAVQNRIDDITAQVSGASISTLIHNTRESYGIDDITAQQHRWVFLLGLYRICF